VTLRIAPQPPPKNKIKPSEPCGQKAAYIERIAHLDTAEIAALRDFDPAYVADRVICVRSVRPGPLISRQSLVPGSFITRREPALKDHETRKESPHARFRKNF
jgi:hypothetical protein